MTNHYPTDWTARCEARCRKTGQQCPHTCDSQVPSTIAGRAGLDADWFTVRGRPARLCRGHWCSWNARSKRLLTLPLIDGGHLSPFNHSGHGSIIVREDRLDFSKENPKAIIPPAWGWIDFQGKVPEGLLDRVPEYVPEEAAPHP